MALTRNAAVDFKKPVAIFSLEMSNIQLVQRLISLEAEISGSKLRNGQLEEYEWQQLHTSIEHLSEAPIFIDDTPGINIFELRAKCRRLKMQHDIQLVIIDYLQLMSGGADNQRGNREQEVSAISRALKGMAKELNVPVIALSQLSRAVEVRGGSKRPQLSDLRESGCLTGDTLLQDAVTGRLVTIKELAERTEQSAMQVVALDEQLKLGGHQMTKAFYSGQKQVFELETRTGRKIKASANHPFLKLRGWTPLEELQLGDRIAVPRKIRIEKPDNPLSGEELILLAHLIGDGCILPNQPYHYTSADPANIEVVSQSARILFGIESAILESPLPETLSQSDILWDEIVSITPLGIEDVYDATVPGVHNFVANDIIVHNSIEQDSDIVSFIYRPEYYQILEDEEGQSLKGIAEIIIAKNRHGALDTIKLRFVDQFAKFADLDESDFDALPDDTFSSPFDGGNIITRPSRMNDDEDIPF